MILACCLQIALATAQVKDPVDLDKLAIEYVALDLPIPPSDAKLTTITRNYEGGGQEFGYVLSKSGRHSQVQIGTAIVAWNEDFSPLDPIPENVRRMLFRSLVQQPYPEDVGLATAVIEHIRGHDEFARQVLKESETERLPADPFKRLYELAMEHWCNAIVERKSDRSDILTHIKKLAADHPTQPKGSLPIADLIQKLELTVNERQRGADSVEIAIDDLCDSQTDGMNVDAFGDGGTPQPIAKLLSLGFTILPGLAKHIEDRRLTRAITVNPTDRRFDYVTVGQVCKRLLSDIVEPASTSDGPTMSFLSRDWLLPFFTKSERENCREGILAAGRSPEVYIRIAESRCPDLLEELYLQAIKYPSTQTSKPLADGLIRSSLPRAKVADLLVQGARSEYVEQCESALRTIIPFDKQLFEHELLFDIARMSTKAGGWEWSDNGTRIGYLVTQTDSPLVWKALSDAALRGDPAERLRIIYAAQPENLTAQQKALRLQLLARIINDPGSLQVIPSTGEGARRISVQDEAILAAARELGISEISRAASEAEWRAFRAQVRSKLSGRASPR